VSTVIAVVSVAVALGSLVVAILARSDTQRGQRLAQEANRIAQEAGLAVSEANRLAVQANQISSEANHVARRALKASQERADFVWRLESENRGELITVMNESSFDAYSVSITVMCEDAPVRVLDGVDVPAFGEHSFTPDLLHEHLLELFAQPVPSRVSIDGVRRVSVPSSITCRVFIHASSSSGVERQSVLDHRFS
jgi:hypothetical protein